MYPPNNTSHSKQCYQSICGKYVKISLSFFSWLIVLLASFASIDQLKYCSTRIENLTRTGIFLNYKKLLFD